MQINFILDKNAKFDLTHLIYKLDCKLVDCQTINGKVLSYETVSQIDFTKNFYYIVPIKFMDNIFIKSWGQIDGLNSYVIEFSPTKINYEEKEVFCGRLWVEKYFYSNSQKMSKDDELIHIYNQLCKWIKKTTKYQKINNEKKYISEDINQFLEKGFKVN